MIPDRVSAGALPVPERLSPRIKGRGTGSCPFGHRRTVALATGIVTMLRVSSPMALRQDRLKAAQPGTSLS